MKKVYINIDMTKDERAIEYHLWVMLAEKQRRGEHNRKIWRGKLVDNVRGLEENVREVEGTSQIGRGVEVDGGNGCRNFCRAGEEDQGMRYLVGMCSGM